MKFDPGFYFQFNWDADGQLFKDPNPTDRFKELYKIIPGEATLFDLSLISEEHPVWRAYLKAESRIMDLREEEKVGIVPTMGVPLFVTTCFYPDGDSGCYMQCIITDLNYGRLIDEETPLNSYNVKLVKDIVNLIYGNFTFNGLPLRFEAIPETCFDDRKVTREILVDNALVKAVDKWNPLSKQRPILEHQLQNCWMMSKKDPRTEKERKEKQKETEKLKEDLEKFYDECDEDISNVMRHPYFALMIRHYFNHHNMRFHNVEVPKTQEYQRTRYYKNMMSFESRDAAMHPLNITSARVVKKTSINKKVHTTLEFGHKQKYEGQKQDKSNRILMCGTLAPTMEGPWGNYDCEMTRDIFERQSKKDENRYLQRKKIDSSAIQYGIKSSKIIFRREEERDVENIETSDLKFKDAIKHNINIIAPDCNAPIPIRAGHMRYEFIVVAVYIGSLIENYQEKHGKSRDVYSGLLTNMIQNISFASFHYQTKYRLSLKPGGMVKLNSFITSKRFSNGQTQESEYKKWSRAFFPPGSISEKINEKFIKEVLKNDRIPVPFYVVKGVDWFASKTPDVQFHAMVATDYFKAVHSSAFVTAAMTITLKSGEQLDVYPETKTTKKYPLHIYPRNKFCRDWSVDKEATDEDIKSSIKGALEFSLKCDDRNIDEVGADDLERVLDESNRHLISEEIVDQLYEEYGLERNTKKDSPIELRFLNPSVRTKRKRERTNLDEKNVKKQRLLDDSILTETETNEMEEEESNNEEESIDADSGGESGCESEDQLIANSSEGEGVEETVASDENEVVEKEETRLQKQAMEKNTMKDFVLKETSDPDETSRNKKLFLFGKKNTKTNTPPVQRNMTDAEVKNTVKELISLYKFSLPCRPGDLSADKLGNSTATIIDKEAMCKIINTKLKKSRK